MGSIQKKNDKNYAIIVINYVPKNKYVMHYS